MEGENWRTTRTRLDGKEEGAARAGWIREGTWMAPGVGSRRDERRKARIEIESK